MRFGTLLWVALLLVSLAATALTLDWFQRNREGPGLLGHTLIGASRLGQAGVVVIETFAGQVTLRRMPWGWGVDEQDGFSADIGLLRALLLRLATTPTTQRLRVGAKRLGELGLLEKIENDWRFEAGKTASVVSVIHDLEHQHRLIYQVLIGNLRVDGGGTYVRFPESSTAYLVGPDLVLDGRPEHWIDRRVFEPDDADDMRRIRIVPAQGPPLTLLRRAANRPWRLEGAGHAPEAARLRELAGTLADLRIVGISKRGQAEGPPPGAARVQVRFRDGREVTLHLAAAPEPEGAGRPAVLSVRPAPDSAGDAAVWRGDAFRWRFAGRVVTLDAAQVRRLLAGRRAYLAGP
jgi:Domain of unknown function (DUF4340)